LLGFHGAVVMDNIEIADLNKKIRETGKSVLTG
jgi:hypothetical protein